MQLSIVSTLYFSAPYLEEFLDRTAAAAAALTPEYEIILVNDGSPDESLAIARDMCRRNDRLRVIDLSRNFGHHKAMMTGLTQATGELVFLIDSDLEEDPELLGRFADELRRTRADVVYGVQVNRKGHLIERFTGAAYYRLFNMLSPHQLPPNLLTVRLMTQQYVRALTAHREREVTIAGLWTITGFRQVACHVDKRHKGRSTYDLRRSLAVVVDSITSFSNRPLVFIFYLGSAISVFAGVAAAYLVARRLFFGVLLAGWPSLIVSVWLLGGVTLLCLGIIGIYLAKIFTETKQRPYTIIRDIYQARAAADDKERPSEPVHAVASATAAAGTSVNQSSP